MAIVVRNLELPTVAVSGGSPLLIGIRELLRVACWTEVSNNGDPGWPDVGGVTNNLVVVPTDLSVDPLYPRRITSASSPFSSAMVGYNIALLATSDQNRSMWKIEKYIDANNIEVDAQGFTPWNWVLESGITGRVTRHSLALVATTAATLWNAPAPNSMQARLFYSTADSQRFYVRPKGNAPIPLATECTYIDVAHSVDFKHRMHMHADGPNLLIWWSTEDTAFEIVMWGELVDTDPGDSDPNFILGAATATATAPYSYGMYMLDGADANIRTFLTTIKRNWSDTQQQQFFTFLQSRLASGQSAIVRSPWACLSNVASVGACVRGRVPIIAHSYEGYAPLRPLDEAGAWLHTYKGLVVPRNGPDDPQPLVPVP